jgi:hypothetical protein
MLSETKSSCKVSFVTASKLPFIGKYYLVCLAIFLWSLF